MVSVGVGYGLAVMYVEMIRVFQASRSDAALIQSIYMGFLTGSGRSNVLPDRLIVKKKLQKD